MAGLGAEQQIAVVGIAVRFPGADDVEAFWRNVCGGLPAHEATNLDPAGFDAGFFGMPDGEAACTDPQHRMFLECCWHAVEAAGYDPANPPGVGAIIAGCSFPEYLQPLMAAGDLIQRYGPHVLAMVNDRDALTARVAHLLDLRGPCLTVQAFSATGPVAVHLAAQSLLLGECDLALAGAVSVHLPDTPADPLLTSRSGRCLPLDARADGTLSGNGVAVVVLRRLADARRDGDHVHAILEGSAFTMAGRARSGFLGVTPAGKAEAIVEALAVAGVDAGDLGYVEAQATGSPVSDAIELRAVDEAFSSRTRGVDPTWRIGSVAANVGHLDTAAGMAGLVKAILMVEHGVIPGQPGFRLATPAMPTGPGAAPRFVVPTTTLPWPEQSPDGATPRRVGLNSFGAGGGNVHLVVRQPPTDVARDGGPVPAGEPAEPHPFVLSARDGGALRRAAGGLHRALAARWDDPPPGDAAAPPSPADVAFTLQASRAAMACRIAFVARSRREVLDGLARIADGLLTPGAGLLHLGPEDDGGNDGGGDGGGDGGDGGGDGGGNDDRWQAARHWLDGHEVDWRSLHRVGDRRRVPLPGYPFTRRRHWIEPDRPVAGAAPQAARQEERPWSTGRPSSTGEKR